MWDKGFIKTKSGEQHFVAFTTANRKELALVYKRLFDPGIGRMVLIAPKKDGTFHSLQMESPILPSDKMAAM